ncbi:MAG: hypothetical protein QM723_32830 [Myxococcaceae bacterium]
MLGLVLAASLASSFPLPSVDGKPLAVTEQQKSFRLPMRFEKVRAFYEEQFKGDAQVSVRVEGVAGERKLAIVNKSHKDSWTKASVSEKATETVVDVTPVMIVDVIDVQGQAGPLVVFVLNRSPEVKKALDSIDHTDDMHH